MKVFRYSILQKMALKLNASSIYPIYLDFLLFIEFIIINGYNKELGKRLSFKLKIL
jgi:hypothetical protein